MLNVKAFNYVLKETNALNGLGPAVTPSTKSSLDGFFSPGTGVNVNVCSNVVVIRNTLLLAKFSPMQRCLPIKNKIILIRRNRFREKNLRRD